MIEAINLSRLVKAKANELGVDLCGITSAKKLHSAETALIRWCNEGMHDRMSYLIRDTNKRANPQILYPDAKSVIVTGLNYFTRNRQKNADAPIISMYALGKDYHSIITGKLNELLDYIKSIVPNAEGKACCDDAPVLEKSWAVEAGIGWQGKNSVVINEDIGSFFFIGILLLNIELDYDKPGLDEKCGNCNACIDNCPTGAINNDKTIDSRKCIANLTINSKGELPEQIIPLMGRRIYSCDVCQEVCPWNENVKEHKTQEFNISDDLANININDWRNLDEKQFEKLFSESPIKRMKFDRFKKNIEVLSQTLGKYRFFISLC
jgi:epoxyqueuosine reductase